MTRLVGFALMLAAALVQVTWAPGLGVYGAFPNLVLTAVVCITWMSGPRSGLAWACLGGLMLDLTAPGPLGPHALALLAGAYLTGFWVRNVDPAGLLQPALAAAATTVVYSLVLVGADDTLGLTVPPAKLAVQLAAAAAAYNAVLVPPALMIVRRLRRAPTRAA
jgi:rod shape-determining protein MreD